MSVALLEQIQALPDKMDSPERVAMMQAFGPEYYADAEHFNILKNAMISLLSSYISTPSTGVVIKFDKLRIYNTNLLPGAGNITVDLAGSNIGRTQKIYHLQGTVPSFPAGWVRMGMAEYEPGQLNVIFAEWISGTRVEYWIVQQHI